MKVAVSGAAGRMGRSIVEALDATPDMEVVGLYSPGHSGERVFGYEISDDPEVCGRGEVVIESTVPDVVRENVERWSGYGAHVVIGTSGVIVSEIEDFWRQDRGCLIVPNFSIGAVMMMKLAELTAPHFSAVEIIEMHHDEKVDAPSGTALSTAERIAATGVGQTRKTASIETVPGVRGGSVSDVRIHSIRLPGLLAHQEVVFGGDGETLTIRHDSMDRRSFMSGVLASVRHVASVQGVEIGLDRAIGL